MDSKIKTVAIITEKGIPGKDIKENTQINVFKLEDNKVRSYESIKLNNNDHKEFSMLLKLKEISLIYTDTITNELKRILNILGIGIKCKDDWEGDKFIEQFVFG
ncbi:MAG: hypothetical protein ACK5KT_03655 [Dysgonomonas sp.]